jgi:hypothetical protein
MATARAQRRRICSGRPVPARADPSLRSELALSWKAQLEQKSRSFAALRMTEKKRRDDRKESDEMTGK